MIVNKTKLRVMGLLANTIRKLKESSEEYDLEEYNGLCDDYQKYRDEMILEKIKKFREDEYGGYNEEYMEFAVQKYYLGYKDIEAYFRAGDITGCYGGATASTVSRMFDKYLEQYEQKRKS